MVFSNSVGLAGIGGDKKYVKVNGTLASYKLLFNENYFSLVGKSGYVIGLGQDIEISDRFVLGDNTFVGFQNAGMGPEEDDDSALGGNFYYTVTPEMKFGLGLPKELGIKGRTFITAERTQLTPVLQIIMMIKV